MPSKRECSRPSEFRKQQHIKRRGEEMVKARDIGEGRSQSYPAHHNKSKRRRI
jgi:hypothetical protein